MESSENTKIKTTPIRIHLRDEVAHIREYDKTGWSFKSKGAVTFLHIVTVDKDIWLNASDIVWIEES